MRAHEYLSVQVLRAVAALCVAVMHATVIWETDPLIHIPVVENSRSLGVYLFFVISGFIIAERMPLETSLPRYLLRRYLRVLPLSVLATGVAILLSVWHGGRLFSIPAAWDGTYDPGPFYILQSVLMVPMDDWPYLSVTWSLPFEVTFYAAFGTLALTLGQRVASVLFIGWALWRWGTADFSLDYDEPTYFAQSYFLFFGFGILAREWLRLSRGPWLPAIVATAGFAGIVAATEFGVFFGNWFIPITGAGFAGLIVWLAGIELRGQGFRRRTFLTWLGDISFSLYMVHLIVVNGTALFFRGAGISPLEADLLRLAVVLASILLAAAVFHGVERPVNRRAKAWIAGLGRPSPA